VVLFKKLFKKEENEAKKKECEHKWEYVELVPKRGKYCFLCNKILEECKKLRCKVCGKETYEHEEKEHKYLVHLKTVYDTGWQTWSEVTKDFCWVCYRKFEDYLVKINSGITHSAECIGKIQHVSDEKLVILNSTDKLLSWINQYANHVSKPTIEEIAREKSRETGVVFYMFPKDPLASTYKVFLPYEVIVKELRYGKGG